MAYRLCFTQTLQPQYAPPPGISQLLTQGAQREGGGKRTTATLLLLIYAWCSQGAEQNGTKLVAYFRVDSCTGSRRGVGPGVFLLRNFISFIKSECCVTHDTNTERKGKMHAQRQRIRVEKWAALAAFSSALSDRNQICACKHHRGKGKGENPRKDAMHTCSKWIRCNDKTGAL
jgi:hypothetical protein